jgi:hypothetical protein
MKIMRETVAALQFALLVGCLSGCRSKPVVAVPDVVHQNALESLEKLQSQVSVGVTHHDYLTSLAEVDFRVGKSGDPKLVEALKWYRAAGEVWAEGMRSYSNDDSSLSCKGLGSVLCLDYPELITMDEQQRPAIVVSEGRSKAWSKAEDSLILAKYHRD